MPSNASASPVAGPPEYAAISFRFRLSSLFGPLRSSRERCGMWAPGCLPRAYARHVRRSLQGPCAGDARHPRLVDIVFCQAEVNGRDCGGDPGPNPSYAASRPKSLRYCMGLLQSRPPFVLASLCHLRQAPSMSMNSSIVTPAQPQPWKSSVSSLPKKPSNALDAIMCRVGAGRQAEGHIGNPLST